MSNRAISIAGAIIVPIMLALCTGMIFVVNALAANAGTDAGTLQRVEQLEQAQRGHASSARRIEATVTQMRVDQAKFVGGAEARVRILEGHHD